MSLARAKAAVNVLTVAAILNRSHYIRKFRMCCCQLRSANWFIRGCVNSPHGQREPGCEILALREQAFCLPSCRVRPHILQLNWHSTPLRPSRGSSLLAPSFSCGDFLRPLSCVFTMCHTAVVNKRRRGTEKLRKECPSSVLFVSRSSDPPFYTQNLL